MNKHATSSNHTTSLAVSIIGLLCLGGCGQPRPEIAAFTPRPDWTLDHGAVVRADRSQRTIALIFTGGAYGEGTPVILDALRDRGIRASFFVTGQYVKTPQFRPWLRRMVTDGHYLGPHSDAHLLYCDWKDRSQTLVTREQFEQDLRANMDALRALGALRGPGPVYFIPPYEWFNEDQVRWAAAMGVVLFNFTPGTGSNRDWAPEEHRAFVPSQTIARDILAYEQREPDGLNGFLLLLHLGSLRED
ncbi:MAG: polysaccharide deacetylase family protein, partial [Phycisphaerae bacterium]|nr:polysaccharide deacetylase family protein [Phycisphaerae bacterium]